MTIVEYNELMQRYLAAGEVEAVRNLIENRYILVNVIPPNEEVQENPFEEEVERAVAVVDDEAADDVIRNPVEEVRRRAADVDPERERLEMAENLLVNLNMGSNNRVSYSSDTIWRYMMDASPKEETDDSEIKINIDELSTIIAKKRFQELYEGKEVDESLDDYTDIFDEYYDIIYNSRINKEKDDNTGKLTVGSTERTRTAKSPIQ